MNGIEALLRRERLLLVLCLLVICGLSWWYLVAGAGTGMSTLAMTSWEFPLPAYSTIASDWGLSYWLIMLLMWWIMMIAMMLPSATPTVLLYARVHRHHQAEGPGPSVAAFLLGYLAVWCAFSVAATALQWLLEQSGWVHGMMMWSTSPVLSGVLLLLAGAYQLSPLKSACLAQCRSPAAWLSSHWRKGAGGAWRMGLGHGAYCVGCCWSLMLLLFVGGIMNLVWIGGLTVLVLLEKLLPRGDWVVRASGVGLLTAGFALLVGWL